MAGVVWLKKDLQEEDTRTDTGTEGSQRNGTDADCWVFVAQWHEIWLKFIWDNKNTKHNGKGLYIPCPLTISVFRPESHQRRRRGRDGTSAFYYNLVVLIPVLVAKLCGFSCSRHTLLRDTNPAKTTSSWEYHKIILILIFIDDSWPHFCTSESHPYPVPVSGLLLLQFYAFHLIQRGNRTRTGTGQATTEFI